MTATVEHSTIVETVGVGSLASMLRDVALFCGRNRDPRVTQYMLLYTENGRLHAWATTRFVMAHAVDASDEAQVSPAVDGELSELQIHYKDAEQAAKAFAKSPVVWINRHDDNTVVLTDGSQSISVTPGDVQLPSFERLVPETPKDSDGETVGFAAENLEKITKVAKKRNGPVMMKTEDPNHPSHWQVGQCFRAAVMPYRLGGNNVLEWLPHHT